MSIAKQPERVYEKLGFSHLETAEIVKSFNLLLANYHVHYQKVRTFHWNVQGANFFELQKAFDEHSEDVKSNIEEIASRIKTFGTEPMGTLVEYVKNSEIKEIKSTVSSFEMVKEVLNDLEKLLSFMIDIVDAANSIGDIGSVELISAFVVKTEKKHWMFTAWLRS